MNKDQFLGQFRALLTALGSALVVWGLSDPTGNNWMPIVGVVMAAVSLGWGLLWHRDPSKPGRLSWSLFRKFINAAGAAAIAYGVVNPEKVHGVEMLVATLGPLLAAWFSWIDNSEAQSPPSGGTSLLILGLVCCFLLGGCAGYAVNLSTPWGDAATDGEGNVILAPKPRIIIPVK